MTRRDRRRAYERVHGIVEHNTGGPQPDAIDREHVLVHVAHTSIDLDQARKALQAAVENGDLERVEGGYRIPGDVSA